MVIFFISLINILLVLMCNVSLDYSSPVIVLIIMFLSGVFNNLKSSENDCCEHGDGADKPARLVEVSNLESVAQVP